MKSMLRAVLSSQNIQLLRVAAKPVHHHHQHHELAEEHQSQGHNRSTNRYLNNCCPIDTDQSMLAWEAAQGCHVQQ